MAKKRKKPEAEDRRPPRVHIPEDDLATRPLARQSVDTIPLSAPGYGSLPVGALLDHRRYEIKRVISTGQKINIYLAEEDVEQRVCPSCREVRNRPTDQFCSTCGVELVNVPVTKPVYLIKESSDLKTFQAESQIATLKLSHPNIIAVHDAFLYAPYGQEQRSYLIIENAETMPLVQLVGRQEEQTVLKWGIQLADALAYLHQNHVAHCRVKTENIVVDDGNARLINFNVASIIPEAGWQTIAPQRYAEDLQGLVQALHHVLTGSESLGAVSVPPAWAKILNRVTGPAEQRYKEASSLAADLQDILDEQYRPASVMWRIGRSSHVGQVRTLNEDSLLSLELSQVRQSVNEPMGLYIVADGMGGHQGGEVASAMAIQEIARHLLEAVLAPALGQEPSLPEGIEGILKDAVQKANQRIRETARAIGNDMGTTAVIALVVGDNAYLANVGDSRAYLLDDHNIKQITMDHSLIQRLLDTGQVTPEEAKTHPQRSAIYRVLGDKAHVEVDTFVKRIKPGERLLLCSDGLNGMIGDDLIHQLVVTNPDPHLACQALVEAANMAGGADNITVILLHLEGTTS